MASRFTVGVFGGIGAGKKLLSEKLPLHFCRRQNQKINIIPYRFFENFENFENFKIEDFNYKIYIDKPLDELLEKYVNSLPIRELIDKNELSEKLRNFREFHKKSIICHKKSADFWIQDVENDEKIHQLALEILKKYRKSEILKKTEDVEESEDVKMLLEQRNVQKSHPSRISNF